MTKHALHVGVAGPREPFALPDSRRPEGEASCERLEVLSRTIPHLLVISSLDEGRILFCNEGLAKFAGTTRADLLGRVTPDFYVDSRDRDVLVSTLHRDGRCDRFETRLRRCDGAIRLVCTSAEVIHFDGAPALMGVSIDITELRRHEQALEEANRVQQELLHEVGHRVGNHLMSLDSLMRRERRSVEGNQDAEAAFDRLSARLQGLSRVHSLLSGSRWQPLPVDRLVHGVVEATCRAMAPDARVDVCAIDQVHVTSAQAQQLALVLGELTLNSLTHGQMGPAPLLYASVRTWGNDIELEYRDTGIGYPEDALTQSPPWGSGLELADQITHHSLRGRTERRNAGGAVMTLLFPREQGSSGKRDG